VTAGTRQQHDPDRGRRPRPSAAGLSGAHLGELPATEPEERRNLESITQQAEQRRDLTRGWLGDSVKLHWLFIEPVLDNDHQATLDLLSRYLDWALYDQLRLRNGLSYGPSVQRESFGDTGLLSLNADLERDDIDKAVKVMQALFDHLRKEGLDPTPSPASRTPASPGKLEHPGQQRLGRLLLGCAERLYRRALRQPGASCARSAWPRPTRR
jgi:predicted Zn-dependent peptidase